MARKTAAKRTARGAPIALLEPGPYWEGWTEAEKAERFASSAEAGGKTPH